MLLRPTDYKKYMDSFNQHDEETVIQHVSNADSWNWLGDQMPLLECPDPTIEETYYFRWWVYRKHLKQTPDGFVITEFHPAVPWAGKHNTINCAVGHHISEGRWLRNRNAFLEDYMRFWFRGGGSLRSYSCWLCDAVLQYCNVLGDYTFAINLLPDMTANYEQWEKSNLNESGLFWSYDDRDAMEHQISGSGLRPTLNSYMYADALAISKIAALAGEREIEARFADKAKRIKALVLEKLWDEEAQFFKVVPLATAQDTVEQWEFARIDPAHNVREQIGFIPWMFNLPDEGYEAAWAQLTDEQGFYADYGPTTAERRHPRFMFPVATHECLWNGPSWPFSTSQTLTAMANLLNHYDQQIVSKADYLNMLGIYAKSHYRIQADGTYVSWLDENLDPFNGEWLSRRILEHWNWREDKGGRERGKDYNHSSFNDLVISGLIGFRPGEGQTVAIHPLVPEGAWDYFCLDRLLFRGKELTIAYDQTGQRYGRGIGLSVYVDGTEVARSQKLDRITFSL